MSPDEIALALSNYFTIRKSIDWYCEPHLQGEIYLTEHVSLKPDASEAIKTLVVKSKAYLYFIGLIMVVIFTMILARKNKNYSPVFV